MARPKTTGRFKYRYQLVEHIWFLYSATGCNQAQIARNVKVSEPVVSKILSQPRPKEL